MNGLAPLLPGRLPGRLAGRLPEGHPGPPGLAQARLSEAVLALIDQACADSPLLVVIEDLHAADVGSLTLLSYVTRRLGDSRALVVVTRRGAPVRDELVTLEQSQRQRGTLLADVALSSLGSSAVSELARAVGDLDSDAIERVVDAAEGNALIAMEAARALASGRPLPVGLRDAVRAAAARLPDDARVLVRTIAVAGRDLDPDEAEQRAGVAVQAALPPAEDEGLLVTVDGRLRFRHSLLREAVYADILALERRDRHVTAAALLQGSMERAAEAAAHLQAAGRTRAAGQLLVLAASKPRALGALADATALLRQAVESLPGDPAPALELADVLAWRGRAADARDAFDKVLPLIEANGDPVAVAAAHLSYAEWHYGPICQPHISVAACRRTLAVLDGAGLSARDMRGRVLAVYAWCESIAGEQHEVEHVLQLLADVAGARRAIRCSPAERTSLAPSSCCDRDNSSRPSNRACARRTRLGGSIGRTLSTTPLSTPLSRCPRTARSNALSRCWNGQRTPCATAACGRPLGCGRSRTSCGHHCIVWPSSPPGDRSGTGFQHQVERRLGAIGQFL